MKMPKEGLHFEQGREKLLKYKSVMTNPNMREAILDDVRIAEGSRAAKELREEFVAKRYKRK